MKASVEVSFLVFLFMLLTVQTTKYTTFQVDHHVYMNSLNGETTKVRYHFFVFFFIFSSFFKNMVASFGKYGESGR